MKTAYLKKVTTAKFQSATTDLWSGTHTNRATHRAANALLEGLCEQRYLNLRAEIGRNLPLRTPQGRRKVNLRSA